MGSVRVKVLKSLAIISVAVVAAVGAAGGVMAVDGAMGPPTAVLPAAEDGHFWARGQTDGGELRLLVDTGATRVSLTRSDAERLGLILTDDAFTHTIATASGAVRVAPVRRKGPDRGRDDDRQGRADGGVQIALSAEAQAFEGIEQGRDDHRPPADTEQPRDQPGEGARCGHDRDQEGEVREAVRFQAQAASRRASASRTASTARSITSRPAPG